MANGSERRGPLLAAALVTVTALLAGGAWWLYGADDSASTRDDAGSARSGPGNKPLDLEVLDWRNATIPGGLCRHQGSIKLRDGTATDVSSTFDGPEANMPQDVSAFTREVVYGDLTGDGRWEAALPVICANHDSTAAGQQAMGVMVFDGATGQLRLIGTLLSQQPRRGEIPNSLRAEKISHGNISGTEHFYGSADPNCCPSGEAESNWRYAHGKLTPAGSTVRATPSAVP
ncbi:hypothetical protein [Streptomyces sp. V3I7]|uniref:hypothetical protein n=1 Tax=Streptomyces sp. V3I7 TaxID=3042278 RepID=UPI002783563F|nr:hypothetical protein [Streptomyces sp. V3I7]MDQ0989084.1 hypothetical protein [Streptomyces sp. V3I7]